MKTIKVKQDPKTKECYFDLKDFAEVVDISKVDSYSLEPIEDCGSEDDPTESRALILKFYDAEGKLVEAKK